MVKLHFIEASEVLFSCTIIQAVPKKRLPFEVKRQCRMFEFECLNSLMSPGMRKTLELGIFTHSWAHWGLKAFKFEHAALALDFKG